MARTYATVDVQNALAKMMAAIDQVKNDSRLDSDYKRKEMARLRSEGNAAAMAAHQAKLATIRQDQQQARASVLAEQQKAEGGVNWARATFLHQAYVTLASNGPSVNELQDSIAVAIEGRDAEALRAWASAMPAVRKGLADNPDYMRAVPTLASMVNQGLQAIEPQALTTARTRLSEIDAAAQQYEQEVKVMSLQATGGLENPEFLRPNNPSIFDSAPVVVQRSEQRTVNVFNQ